MTTTDDRIAALEQELASMRRLHRRLLAGVAVIGLAVACTGASSIVESVKELHAQSIVLEDANGKPLARLGAVKGGGAELTFTDTQGKRRAVVGYTEEGSHLNLFDKEGNQRAIVAAHGDRPSVALTGKNDKVRVSLAAEVGGSSLYLFDDDFKPRAIYRVDTQEGPTVNLLSGEGKMVWVAPKDSK